MENLQNLDKSTSEQSSLQKSIKESNIERERFITLLSTQVDYLKKVRAAGKGAYIKNRDMLLNEMRNNLWYAYANRTLSYKMYQELLEMMREAFSHDNIIGVHQISIFDMLPDEPFEKPEPNVEHTTH